MSRFPRNTPSYRFLLPVLAAGTLVSAAALTATAHADAGNDPIVAVVDGKTFHRSDLQPLLDQLIHQEPRFQGATVDDPQLYPHLQDQLINEALVYNAAEKLKVERDPELKKALAFQHESLVNEFYISKIARDAATPAAEQAYYQNEVTTNSVEEEIHARHILVSSEDEATDIIAQLDKGADFAKLVHDKSLDNSNGGDLPWFTKEHIMPEIGEAAFALKKGEYTKTPVQSKYGWHVIQVLDTRPAPLADVKDVIDHEIAAQVIHKKINALRDSAQLRKYGLDGKVVQSQ